MRWGPLIRVLRHLGPSKGSEEGTSDGELLERYLARQDEMAFAALMERHGPMVLGVCRRMLANEQDAEDAFQATFLVLVRKGRSVVPRGAVGNWLYGVARRTAAHARSAASARRVRERVLARPELQTQEAAPELGPVLDQELARLPDKYRAPVVLCDLEGKTRREAALELGWPEGTVAGRLSRARTLLAGRLARRGLALSPATLAAVLPQQACAVGRSLALRTQQALGGAVAASVRSLAEATLRSLLVTRLSVLMMFSVVLLLGGSAAAVFAFRRPTPATAETPAPKLPPPTPVAGKEKLPPGAARQQDLARLEGTWIATEVETEGKKAPPAFVRRIQWRFEKGFLMVKGSLGDNREIPCTFEIDTTKTPRAISYANLGSRQQVLGIYEVKDDRLRVCIIYRNRPRPAAFTTAPGSGLTRIVFQRKK
jgi:RNA polymerase sigma factor (sigma-70 family)